MTNAELWEKLTKLGQTERVKEFIEKTGKELADFGYENYTMDALYLAMMEGVERAGAYSHLEFKSPEVLAKAYLLGFLLGGQAIAHKV